MMSLCDTYYQFFLAQAVLLGISMSFSTWPPVAVVSRHLPQHRGVALGIVIGGSSIGGIIWPLVLQRLFANPGLGFGWSIRIVGFIMLPLFAVACITVREAPKKSADHKGVGSEGSVSDGAAASEARDRFSELDLAEGLGAPEGEVLALEQSQEKKGTDLSNLRNPSFLLICAGFALAYFGLFTPLFYVSSYALDIGLSDSMAFYLLSIMNASSFFGRVVPGILADRYGHFNLCLFAQVGAAVTAFTWTAATTEAGLIVWAVAYGFMSGVSLHLG